MAKVLRFEVASSTPHDNGKRFPMKAPLFQVRSSAWAAYVA
jgi:hypothetical protein